METSEPLPEPNLNPSISSVEGIPASRSARPESGPEPQPRGIFGPKPAVSFAYLDPATCCWKTSQDTFLSGLETYSETWPDAGMMRNGVVYEQAISEPRTSASEFSLWPTADTGESLTGHGRRGGNVANGYQSGADLKAKAQSWTDSLTGATRNWPTPNAHDATGARGTGFELTDHHYSPHDLVSMTDTWKTPHGMSNRDFRGKIGGCGGGEFANQANHWDAAPSFFPTPGARDYRTPNAKTYSERGGKTKGEQLPNFVEHSLPVPQIQDGPTSCENGPTLRRRFPTPSASMATVQDMEQASYAGNDPNRPKYRDLEKRRLNPRFVEFLMGLPIGWTELCETGPNALEDSVMP